jgi:hypothetical protein
MTNSMHAQRALAYDVAVGTCNINEIDLKKLRIAADWRLLKSLTNENPHKIYFEYFDSGSLEKKSLLEWASKDSSDGRIPSKIINAR